MLGFDVEYTSVHPKARFWHFLAKNCEKSAVKHSIEKPILLNFVNLSPTFCPRLLFDLALILKVELLFNLELLLQFESLLWTWISVSCRNTIRIEGELLFDLELLVEVQLPFHLHLLLGVELLTWSILDLPH